MAGWSRAGPFHSQPDAATLQLSERSELNEDGESANAKSVRRGRARLLFAPKPPDEPPEAPPGAGTREPRRPLTPVPSLSIALPLPEEDLPDDDYFAKPS